MLSWWRFRGCGSLVLLAAAGLFAWLAWPGSAAASNIARQVYYQLVGVGGSSQTPRGRLNLIAGANMTVTPADNSGSNSTDVTVASTGASAAQLGLLGYANWYPLANGIGANWRGACWGTPGFVIVSVTTGQFVFSADGIKFEGVSAGNSNQWQDCAWNGTAYVAVSQNGTGTRVTRSLNGTSWSVGTSAADNPWTRVAGQVGGAFAAVSATGTDRVQTSPDGITWTAINVAASTWQGICASPSLFLAVGASGVLMTSPDGITWTARTASYSGDFRGCSYGEPGGVPTWVVVGAAGAPGVMTSPDAITWTSRTSGDSSLTWTDVAWNGQAFAAVATDGNFYAIQTSPTGVTWSLRNVPPLPPGGGSIGLGNIAGDPVRGKFVAASTSLSGDYFVGSFNIN